MAVFKTPNTHFDQYNFECDASKSVFSPVHRLDFETQGLLLLAHKDHWEKYHALFKPQSSLTEKFYLAGTVGPQIPEASYSGFIGSRYRSSKKVKYSEHETEFRGYHSVLDAKLKVLDVSLTKKNISFFEGLPHLVQLISGRRHQIRAFFASLQTPLVGDPLYGNKQDKRKLELFSWKLNFLDPYTEEKISLETPLEFFQTNLRP